MTLLILIFIFFGCFCSTCPLLVSTLFFVPSLTSLSYDLPSPNTPAPSSQPSVSPSIISPSSAGSTCAAVWLSYLWCYLCRWTWTWMSGRMNGRLCCSIEAFYRHDLRLRSIVDSRTTTIDLLLLLLLLLLFLLLLLLSFLPLHLLALVLLLLLILLLLRCTWRHPWNNNCPHFINLRPPVAVAL